MSGTTSIAVVENRFAALSPGITAALSFSAADVLGKVVFNDGMDVLSFVTTRGVLTVIVFGLWLRVSPPARRHTKRERLISIGVGVMFAANIFGLLLAIELLPLSIAILTYFIYPLLTGLAGAVTGIDRMGWRGCIAALAAFAGLGMMLDAQLGNVPLLGVVSALGAAVVRVVSLLITRSSLARHRFAAEHLVFPGAVSRGLCRVLVGDPHLESTAKHVRLGGVRWHERGQHGLRADDLHLDHPDRCISHGIDHEFGTAGVHAGQRRAAGRGVAAGPGGRWRTDAGGVVRVSVAALNPTASVRRPLPRAAR